MPIGRLRLLLRMDACITPGEQPLELVGPMLVDRTGVERVLQRFVDLAGPPGSFRPGPSQLLTKGFPLGDFARVSS
jgi:hypothetical protein